MSALLAMMGCRVAASGGPLEPSILVDSVWAAPLTTVNIGTPHPDKTVLIMLATIDGIANQQLTVNGVAAIRDVQVGGAGPYVSIWRASAPNLSEITLAGMVGGYAACVYVVTVDAPLSVTDVKTSANSSWSGSVALNSGGFMVAIGTDRNGNFTQSPMNSDYELFGKMGISTSSGAASFTASGWSSFAAISYERA